MNRAPSTMTALLLAAIALPALATPVDYAWTAYLAGHTAETFSEIMGQSMFEGELPGGGDPLVLFLIGMVGLYYATLKAAAGSRLSRMRPAVGFLMVASLVSAVFTVHGLKWMMGRARPDAVFSGALPFTAWFAFGPQLMSQGIFHGSFPSGHTALAFTPFSMVYVLAPRRAAAAAAVGTAAALYALAMGTARCMTASHWVTDVAGALALSVATMHLLYYRLLRVPAQEAALAEGRRPGLAAPGWELWLSLMLGLAFTGAMALVCGLRIWWHQGIGGWTLLAPAGAGLLWFGARQVLRIRRRLMD